MNRFVYDGLKTPPARMGQFLEDSLEGLVKDYKWHYNLETLDKARQYIKLRLTIQTNKEGGELR